MIKWAKGITQSVKAGIQFPIGARVRRGDRYGRVVGVALHLPGLPRVWGTVPVVLWREDKEFGRWVWFDLPHDLERVGTSIVRPSQQPVDDR